MSKRTRIAITVIAILVLASGFVLLDSRFQGGARLAIRFSHFETHYGHDYAVVLIRNDGDRAASFCGYGNEWPFYYVVNRSETNWSWEYSPGFDWDRVRRVTLPPGSTMPVRTGVPIPDGWMVGLEYRAASIEDYLPGILCRSLFRIGLPRRSSDIAWSAPLTRASPPQNIAPVLVTKP
jgi:hypothetical protein